MTEIEKVAVLAHNNLKTCYLLLDLNHEREDAVNAFLAKASVVTSWFHALLPLAVKR